MRSSSSHPDAAPDQTLYPGFPEADEYQGRGDGDEWVRRVFERLRRGKSIILSVTALGVLAALLIVWQITPRYSATAMILVGVPKQHVVDVEDVLQGIRTDRGTLESEIEVLTSRSLAAKVVDRLGLVDEPAYNARLRPQRRSILSTLNPLNWIPRPGGSATKATDAAKDEPVSEEERARRTRQAVTARVKGSVRARIKGRSRVINVTATSTDPKLAASVVNTLSDLYLVEQLETKFEATQRAADWLNSRVDELREQVETSERAVEEYRRQHGLIQSNDTTVTEQQVSGVTNQLISARTKTTEAEARLRQIRSLLDSGGVESASDVLASTVVQKLREQETNVARQVAEMATVYGPLHPKLINVRAELEEVRNKLGAEVDKIVRSLENELEVARIREQTLNGDLDRLKTDTERLNAAQSRLRVLEREAAANRTLFDTFLGRWKETGRQDEIQRADARILSRAVVPRAPSSPKTARIVGVAFVFSFVLGIGIVFLVEHLDNGFRTAEQLERTTGLGVLSVVPNLKLPKAATDIVDYLLDKPASAFAESFRTLHTGLQLIAGDGDGKSILVGSSVPEEGKTTVAVALARTLAKAGHHTLLIDADMRTDQVAKLLKMDGGARCLARYLTAAEEVALPDVLTRDEKGNVDLILAGSDAPSNTVDLFRSQRMKDLIAACKTAYDFVILDSPPTLLLSDSRVLANLTDRVVFVTRWASVRRDATLKGLDSLVRAAGETTIGLVLNAAEASKGSRQSYYNYGYGYGYGRGHYARYYAD